MYIHKPAGRFNEEFLINASEKEKLSSLLQTELSRSILDDRSKHQRDRSSKSTPLAASFTSMEFLKLRLREDRRNKDPLETNMSEFRVNGKPNDCHQRSRILNNSNDFELDKDADAVQERFKPGDDVFEFKPLSHSHYSSSINLSDAFNCHQSTIDCSRKLKSRFGSDVHPIVKSDRMSATLEMPTVRKNISRTLGISPDDPKLEEAVKKKFLHSDNQLNMEQITTVDRIGKHNFKNFKGSNETNVHTQKAEVIWKKNEDSKNIPCSDRKLLPAEATDFNTDKLPFKIPSFHEFKLKQQKVETKIYPLSTPDCRNYSEKITSANDSPSISKNDCSSLNSSMSSLIDSESKLSTNELEETPNKCSKFADKLPSRNSQDILASEKKLRQSFLNALSVNCRLQTQQRPNIPNCDKNLRNRDVDVPGSDSFLSKDDSMQRATHRLVHEPVHETNSTDVINPLLTVSLTGYHCNLSNIGFY